MIPKEWKRLAEVDFPIEMVSKHAANEKSNSRFLAALGITDLEYAA